MKVADIDHPASSSELMASRTPELLVFAAAFLVPWLLIFIAKWILPWHSGAASVWMIVVGFGICVGSFGWILGAVLSSRLSGATQKIPQFVLLVGMLLSLPVAPGAEWQVAAPNDAAILILKLLALKAGPSLIALSYFLGSRFARASVVSTEAPILILRSGVLGAITSLVVYLFFLEPLLSQAQHNLGFSWCVLAFAVSTGWWIWRTKGDEIKTGGASGIAGDGWGSILQFGLSGSAIAFLLVVSLRFQRDAVSVPLLWAVPLLVFLASAFVVLARPEVFNRRVLLIMFLVTVAGFAINLFLGLASGIASVRVLLSLVLAVVSITSFSLLTGGKTSTLNQGTLYRFFGGAIVGAVAIVFVAPKFSTGYTEYQIALFVLCLFVWLSALPRGENGSEAFPTIRVLRLGGAAAMVVLGTVLYASVFDRIEEVKGRIRTFYGVTSSVQIGVPPKSYMMMMVGDHPRAAEFMSSELRLAPSFWQGPATGIGLTFRAMPKGNFRNIGIIGVGNGGLMAYLDATDTLTFYEYDAGAVVTANQQFAYFPNALIDYNFVPGDPRLTLADTEPQEFDILILDALNAESLPVHLVTREAFEIWNRHLGADGVLAVNITNDKFDLAPVIWRQALEFGWETILIANPDDPQNLSAAAEWLVLTKNAEFLRKGNFRAPTPEMSEAARQFPLWTDESSNPLSLVK